MKKNTSDAQKTNSENKVKEIEEVKTVEAGGDLKEICKSDYIMTKE